MLIYIHGFDSAPQSFKARITEEWFAARGRTDEYRCPALPPSPRAAMALLEAEIAGAGPGVSLIGSSLGGYYATALAERHGLKAALLNPAVRPYELLAAHTGKRRNHHTGEEYEFTPGHVEELRTLEIPAITAARYQLLTATADEVLDYRAGVERYRGAEQIIIQGSSHGLPEYPQYLERVLSFCGVA